MNKNLMRFALVTFFWMFTACFAAQDPASMLRGVADQMISSLKSSRATLKTNPGIVYSLTYRIVVPHADLDTMSKRVLPPQTWNSASVAQRSEFKKEFTALLVRTYASALANYTDQTVRFYPARANTNSAQVNSEIIRSDGPAIPITYRLVRSGAGWKLYDMSVEGISMLESFRSQFADKLGRANMPELISALRQHNSIRGR